MRKFIKLIAASLVCTVAFSSAVFAGEPDTDGVSDSSGVLQMADNHMAAGTDGENYKEFTGVTSDVSYGNYQLEWEFDSSSIYDLLSEVSCDNTVLESYTYDDNFLRTSKLSDGVLSTYVYDENCKMTTAYEGEHVLEYYYDKRENGSLFVKGFVFEGENYEFLYDNFIIEGIIKNQDIIARYAYGANYSFEGTYVCEDGEWVECEDDHNVANINKVRYVQAYYDDVTGWYYMGRYYDPEMYRYVDGFSFSVADELLEEYGPIVYLRSNEFALPFNGISVCTDPIMNGLQVVTRVIYAESGTSTDDQHAVAWVIYNRAGGVVGKAYDVVTEAGQFAAYENGSYLFDYDSRNQAKWSTCYHDAYYVITGKAPDTTVAYINSQTQFRSVNSFESNYYVDGNNNQVYKYKDQYGNDREWIINNVAIPGEMSITANSNPNYNHDFKYNIYFNIVGNK